MWIRASETWRAGRARCDGSMAGDGGATRTSSIKSPILPSATQLRPSSAFVGDARCFMGGLQRVLVGVGQQAKEDPFVAAPTTPAATSESQNAQFACFEGQNHGDSPDGVQNTVTGAVFSCRSGC